MCIRDSMHLLRAGATWNREVRWDGIGTRKGALEMLRARTKTAPRGEWIYTLGGWTVDQFSDNKRPFTRDELDEIVPDHPLLLQASYYETYLNSRALQALGLDGPSAKNEWLVRDDAGRPTGRIREAGVREVAGKLPAPSPNDAE